MLTILQVNGRCSTGWPHPQPSWMSEENLKRMVNWSRRACRLVITGNRKGIRKVIQQEMKHRSGIEPGIGYQKFGGELGRTWLKDVLGEVWDATLCAAGHNLRKLLAHPRHLIVLIRALLLAALRLMSRAFAREPLR